MKTELVRKQMKKVMKKVVCSLMTLAVVGGVFLGNQIPAQAADPAYGFKILADGTIAYYMSNSDVGKTDFIFFFADDLTVDNRANDKACRLTVNIPGGGLMRIPLLEMTWVRSGSITQAIKANFLTTTVFK